MPHEFSYPSVREIKVPREPLSADNFIEEFEMEPPINPWLRANVGEHNPETRNLIPPASHDDYDKVMQEMVQSGAALSEALGVVRDARLRMAVAEQRRNEFFGGLHGSA